MTNSTIFIVYLFFVPVYIIIYEFLKRPLLERGKDAKEKASSYSGNIIESVELTPEIKIDGSATNYNKKLLLNFEIYFDSLLKFSKVSIFFNSLDSFVSVLFQAIVLVLGGISVITGKLTIGDFSVLLIYFNMLIKSLRYFLEYLKNKQDVNVAIARMDDIYLCECEIFGTKKISQINSIKFDNVCFKYNHSNDTIVGFSKIIEKNNIVLIKGKNGAGKSTLANILMGLLRCQAGGVYYNDIEISDIDMHYLRYNSIVYIPQKRKYPNSTVREFLDYNAENNNLYARELFLKYFSFNIDKYLNRNILHLSEGEKQKINLYKTVSKNASFIILDEPESFLDKVSNIAFKQFLLEIRLNKIILIITHSDYLNDIADDIITL